MSIRVSSALLPSTSPTWARRDVVPLVFTSGILLDGAHVHIAQRA